MEEPKDRMTLNMNSNEDPTTSPASPEAGGFFVHNQRLRIFQQEGVDLCPYNAIMLLYGRKKGGICLSPIGRPSDDPKTKRLELRISDNDLEKLDFCCKQTGLSRAEIIRRGIQRTYEELNKKK